MAEVEKVWKADIKTRDAEEAEKAEALDARRRRR